MKAGWEVKELGAVSAINYGYTESASSEPIGPRFLRITDIQNDRVDWDNVPYCKIEPSNITKYRLASGDIVFARTGATTGKSFLIHEPPDAVFASYLIRLRLLDRKLLPEFVSLFFQTNGYWQAIKDGSAGSAQGGFNATKLSALSIPIPPLPEQQRIVGILDDAFDGIATAKANAEKNLQNARALFESHLHDVFIQRGERWKRVRIEDACESIMDCVNKTAPKVGGPTPFKMIRTTNVRNGRVNLDSVNYVTEDVYLLWTRRQVPKRGDVILTREAPMGEVGMLLSNDKVFLGQRLVSYRAHPAKLDNRFLLYAFQSGDLQGQIHALASGATVQHMRVPDSKNLRLSMPSLIEQREIVAKLDALKTETQRLESIYRRKLAALEELKKSLLHQAFTGQLTEHPRRAVVIPFPTKIPGVSTTDLHAGILAIAFQLHETNGKQNYFGHVKAEKIAHMVEAYLGIELGRTPMKDAAGPNDFHHIKGVEHRARMANFFDFQRVEGGGYRVSKHRRFEELIERTREHLGERSRDVDNLLELMLPMDTEQSEVFATVYAAWNNLLLNKQAITDENIVFEARENWHPDKLKIERWKFFKAIEWIKEHAVIPQGRGKKVNSRAKKK